MSATAIPELESTRLELTRAREALRVNADQVVRHRRRTAELEGALHALWHRLNVDELCDPGTGMRICEGCSPIFDNVRDALGGLADVAPGEPPRPEPFDHDQVWQVDR